MASDEDDDERRRRKKAKKAHAGDHRHDAVKDSHRAAKPRPSRRVVNASHEDSDSSEARHSDTE
jgi:hypothetical protein